MGHALLITPFFPPTGGPGVQRMAKLVKYAPTFGWTSTVVTLRDPPFRNYPTDQGLRAELGDIDIRRTRRLNTRLVPQVLYRLGAGQLAEKPLWLLPTDGFVGWLPFAAFACQRLLHEKPVDVVITTGPPFSTHLLGVYLKKRFGLPWVADFRDPWTTSDLTPEYSGDTTLSRWKLWLDSGVERFCLRYVDHIVVVVDQHRHDLIAHFGVPPKRITRISNGYDEEDFTGIPYPIAPCPDTFRIGYFGSFTAEHHPLPFLRMLRRLLQRCDAPEDVRFRVVGRGCHWMRANAESWADMADHVELIDYLEHRPLLERFGEHALLFITFPRPWVMTGKMFEYVRSGLPIFGVAPISGTPMEELLKRVGSGVVHTADDIEGGANELCRLYRSWRDKTAAVEHRIEEVQQFERRTLVRQMVKILDEVHTSAIATPTDLGQ